MGFRFYGYVPKIRMPPSGPENKETLQGTQTWTHLEAGRFSDKVTK